MNRNRPISLALVGLFLWQTGCSSWQQIQIGELPDYDKVRVTSVSVGSTEVEHPRIEADSIKGTVDQFDYAIPLSGVEMVEVRRASNSKTLGLVVAIIVGVALVAVTAAAIACSATDCFEDYSGI